MVVHYNNSGKSSITVKRSHKMVVHYNNYGQSSITVKHTQHTMSVHYSIRNPNWIITLFRVCIYTNFHDNDLLLLRKWHVETYWIKCEL